MFKKIKYKHYQKWFCKQYVKRSVQLTNYKYFLKNCDKKDSLPSSFFCVSLYDVLDNNGMNCLMKSIYKLKNHRKKYDVDTPYIHHKFKKLNYIYLTNSETRGIVAELKFKTSKWIESVEIHFTYLNMSQCLIQYVFKFKKLINTSLQIHNFVIDEILKIRKEPYFHNYANKNIIKSVGYKEMLQLEDVFFADILQGYICKMFYTEYGKEYKLPIEYCMNLRKYNFKKRKKLRKLFLHTSYEKGRDCLVVTTLNYNRFELTHYNAGKYLPVPILLEYFSRFTTEVYYMTFCHIETIELEKKMRKYLNSRKKFISSKDIKWFINRVRYINEQKPKIESHLVNRAYSELNDNLLNWKKYELGKPDGQDFINYPKYTDYYLKQYEQNLEYLSSLSSVQNNLIVIIVAVLTLFATLVGIIITIIK